MTRIGKGVSGKPPRPTSRTAVRSVTDDASEIETGGAADTSEADVDGEQVLPLHEEVAECRKQVVRTGVVRVSRRTRQEPTTIEAQLAQHGVVIDRKEVGKPVDRIPAVRADGDTIVIPVVEEVLITRRQLVLKEEVRIRPARTSRRHVETVVLRKNYAVVERIREDGSIENEPARDAAPAVATAMAGAWLFWYPWLAAGK
jgi:uncharacterized protein (TIGR02271 family)